MNIANLNKTKESTESQISKLVIFPVANLNVALHINVVQKIINYSTIFSSRLNHFGLVNIGDQEITVIDLHKKLFNISKSEDKADSNLKKYLILAENQVAELFGIVIDEPPKLLDVPLNKIRTIPASYRQADTLAIASHVAVIPQDKDKLTIFILDPDELIRPIA